MNTKLFSGLLPALGLSMGTMCSIMAEGASDGATGGGAATSPAQPAGGAYVPIVPPPAPVAANPAATQPAAADPANPTNQQGSQYVTLAQLDEAQRKTQEVVRNTIAELLKGVAPQAPPAPQVTQQTTAAPAPAAPPVPPQPPAPPPAPVQQPAQQLQQDPAFVNMKSQLEETQAQQRKYSEELAKMKAEKEAAEEKARLVDTQIAVRKALEGNQLYKLTNEAVSAAAEVLMLKGLICRGKDGNLYVDLGLDDKQQKKYEPLDKGVTSWLETQDARVYRQAVPAGMGFQGSSANGIPHSFPQGAANARPQAFSQGNFISAASKELIPGR